jgi:hypothetical protein
LEIHTFQITDKPFPITDNEEPSPINTQGISWSFNKFILNEYISEGGTPVNVKVINKTEIKDQIPIILNLVSFYNQ